MQKITKELIKKYKKNEEIINYLIVGGLTTIISFLTYLLFSTLLFNSGSMLDIQISNVLSWIIAVLFAYLTNRKYVFKSKSKNIDKEIAKFTLSRVFSLLVDMVLMFILINLIFINDLIAKIIVQVIIILLNYILSKLIVFKKRPL